MLYLKPRAVYPDPFRTGNHVLVLCDVMSPPAVQVEPLTLVLTLRQIVVLAECAPPCLAVRASSPLAHQTSNFDQDQSPSVSANAVYGGLEGL